MKKSRFHEPSLVPLADMLTNTVGIVVFILIFTVLTTGSAMVTKRLPMERSSDTSPLEFLCTKGRLLPLPTEASIKRFLEPLGKLQNPEWLEKFETRTLDTDYFLLKGEVQGPVIALVYKPKPGAGDTEDELTRPNSALQRTLAAYSPAHRFAYFLVDNDSIAVFIKAREIATRQFGYGYGWRAVKRDEPVGVTLSGGGYTPQQQ